MFLIEIYLAQKFNFYITDLFISQTSSTVSDCNYISVFLACLENRFHRGALKLIFKVNKGNSDGITVGAEMEFPRFKP